MIRLRTVLWIGAAAVLLAGCASTVGGSAVAGTSGASSSTVGPPATDATTPAAPETTGSGGLPSLNLPTIVVSPSPQSASGDTTQSPSTSASPTPVAPTPPSSTQPMTPTVVTTTVGTTTQSTPSTPSATSTHSTPSSGDPFAGATTVDPKDFPGYVTPVGFATPSGNIACGFQPTKNPDVVCQIQHHTYPNPKACVDGPTGGAVDLNAGGTATFTCYSDLESGGPVLGYGKMITVSTLSCVSRETGITCRDTSTGNWFRLATASYEFVNNGKTTAATAPASGTTTLSRFDGDWGGHGRELVFTSPGHGTVTYRSYVWCSDNPNPPCDSTKDNQIVAGGSVTIKLTSASNNGYTATGVVTASNDPQHPEGTAVTANISGYDLTLSIFTASPFCAADTPSDKWDCGA